LGGFVLNATKLAPARLPDSSQIPIKLQTTILSQNWELAQIHRYYQI
jgi:hypothetical protein